MPRLAMTGDELLQIQEWGRDVLMRECTAREMEQILKRTESVSPVGVYNLPLVSYAPGVVVHSKEWIANFGINIVVLNCCPNDDGALTQVVLDIRDEDILLRAQLTVSLGRELDPGGRSSHETIAE